MIFRDLRGFLDELERQGQLVHVRQSVRPEPDIAAAGRAATDLGLASPALLFHALEGYGAARLALNVVGSWANHALMLGLPKTASVREQFHAIAQRWTRFPVPVERVAEAPFQDNITTEIDLFALLPLARVNPMDGGFYLDKAVVISRDPDDPENPGKQNVGYYRLQVKDKNRLGLQPVPMHDIALHLRKAEERGENLPVAIAIGTDPILASVASAPLRYDQSEYEMAGALAGQPYRVVRSDATGLDLPWGAEIILEGEVLCGARELEGPFGEFTGSYSGLRRQPVIQLSRALYRHRPIFEQCYVGTPWTEVDTLIGLPTCVPIYHQLKTDFPEVEAVNALYTHGLATIISTRQRFGGFAKAVAMRALSTPHGIGYCKIVIMVDDTVDPFNLAQVMWALSTRFDPAKDMITVPTASILPLDPLADPPGIATKIILDATTPMAPDKRGDFSRPVEIPPGTKEWTAILGDLWAKAKAGER
ncbi:MAG: UbiD family decarboxylase [Rhodospirillales bacterium]|nr:UbiD family decarboxylase [Rhodospirillales bacterium]